MYRLLVFSVARSFHYSVFIALRDGTRFTSFTSHTDQQKLDLLHLRGICESTFFSNKAL